MKALAALAIFLAVPALAGDAASELSDGQTALQAGDYGAAAGHFRNAIKTSPASREAERSWVNLALIDLSQGKAGEAVSDCDAALKIKADDAKALNTRATALLSLRRFDDALAGFQAAAEADKHDGTAYANLGKLALMTDDMTRAAQFYALSRAADPTNADAYIGLSQIALAKHDTAMAVTDAEAAVKYSPENAAALTALGQARIAAGNSDQAIEPLAKASKLAPTVEDPHLQLGIALFNVGAFGDAGMALADALDAAPKDPEVHLYSGLCFYHLAETDAADTEFTHALNLGAQMRDRAVALYHKGLIRDDAGKLAEAEKLYSEAGKADPTYPQAPNNLGLVYQRQNRLTEAASEYRRALKADDGYAVARLNLAGVLSLMGQNDAARAELLKLKSLPAGSELRMKAESMLAGLARGSKG